MDPHSSRSIQPNAREKSLPCFKMLLISEKPASKKMGFMSALLLILGLLLFSICTITLHKLARPCLAFYVLHVWPLFAGVHPRNRQTAPAPIIVTEAAISEGGTCNAVQPYSGSMPPAWAWSRSEQAPETGQVKVDI